MENTILKLGLFIATLFTIDYLMTNNQKTYISHSKINGNGLFASKEFKKGDILIQTLNSLNATNLEDLANLSNLEIKFVPINIIARYSGFWSNIEDAHFDSRFPCFSHTSTCNELADNNAISELE